MKSNIHRNRLGNDKANRIEREREKERERERERERSRFQIPDLAFLSLSLRENP